MSPIVQSCTAAAAACNDVNDYTPVVVTTLAVVFAALVVLVLIGIRRFSK